MTDQDYKLPKKEDFNLILEMEITPTESISIIETKKR